jgi:hypothetical protein
MIRAVDGAPGTPSSLTFPIDHTHPIAMNKMNNVDAMLNSR